MNDLTLDKQYKSMIDNLTEILNHPTIQISPVLVQLIQAQGKMLKNYHEQVKQYGNVDPM
jgi:hypothetical protein